MIIAPLPIYFLDEIAAEHGHEVQRTPPYHPELQPIETCLAIVKNQISRHCDFTMTKLVLQLEQSFQSVTAKTCSKLINKIRKIEDQFWGVDVLFDVP